MLHSAQSDEANEELKNEHVPFTTKRRFHTLLSLLLLLMSYFQAASQIYCICHFFLLRFMIQPQEFHINQAAVNEHLYQTHGNIQYNYIFIVLSFQQL